MASLDLDNPTDEQRLCVKLYEQACKDRDSALAACERKNEKINELSTRISELLATIVRLTNETPFADEAKDALEQRGKLVAEIGTLRAERAETIGFYVGELGAARAENDRMRPVYEAARAWGLRCAEMNPEPTYSKSIRRDEALAALRSAIDSALAAEKQEGK